MRSRIVGFRGMACIIAATSSLALAGGRMATGGSTSIVHLQDRENAPVGEARLRQTPNGILLSLSLSGLPAGEHGLHIHERGACVPPFDGAGGHFDPDGHAHGFADPRGPHAGDLPNVFVGADGRATLELFVPGLVLASGEGTPVIDADGAALVIHAGADDHRSDPAGAAGDRIACGVIEAPTRRPIAAAAPRVP